MSLHRLIYLSRCAKPVDSNQLLAMCSQFASHNALSGISGLLLLVGDHFLQIIEGAEDDVRALMLKITEDPRHSEVMLLSECAAQQRLFGSWGMRGIDVNAGLALNPALRLRLQRQVHATSQDARDPESARQLVSDIASLLRGARVSQAG